MTGRPRKNRSAPLPVREVSNERQAGESDEQYYLRILPPPPLTMAAHDDVVAEWVQDVYAAAGIAGVEWIFDTMNWPLGSEARGRMLHYLGVLRHRDTEWAKRRAEQAAEDALAEAERRRHDQRKAAGWA
jgi:hypothetical protein